jgi:hypothetical protein
VTATVSTIVKQRFAARLAFVEANPAVIPSAAFADELVAFAEDWLDAAETDGVAIAETEFDDLLSLIAAAQEKAALEQSTTGDP